MFNVTNKVLNEFKKKSNQITVATGLFMSKFKGKLQRKEDYFIIEDFSAK